MKIKIMIMVSVMSAMPLFGAQQSRLQERFAAIENAARPLSAAEIDIKISAFKQKITAIEHVIGQIDAGQADLNQVKTFLKSFPSVIFDGLEGLVDLKKLRATQSASAAAAPAAQPSEAKVVVESRGAASAAACPADVKAGAAQQAEAARVAAEAEKEKIAQMQNEIIGAVEEMNVNSLDKFKAQYGDKFNLDFQLLRGEKIVTPLGHIFNRVFRVFYNPPIMGIESSTLSNITRMISKLLEMGANTNAYFNIYQRETKDHYKDIKLRPLIALVRLYVDKRGYLYQQQQSFFKDIYNMLLKYGADEKLTDSEGHTPQSYWKKQGYSLPNRFSTVKKLLTGCEILYASLFHNKDIGIAYNFSPKEITLSPV